jgi:Uncharacterised nucleotidyltransferase
MGAEPVATFRLDVKYTHVAAALLEGGVETVLLKGPAFDQLLFEGKRARGYRDIDLLVDPARLPAAEGGLSRLGFRRARQESVWRALGMRIAIAIGARSAEHSTAWIRDGDRFVVDLHHTLPEVGTSADETWRALRAHRSSITVVDAPAETLDRTASALLIALHCAHHGPRWNRAREDLERACAVVDRDCWLAAARLAHDLRAGAAMGIGLGTTPAGSALARELGLPTAAPLARRAAWTGIVWLDRRRSPV